MNDKCKTCLSTNYSNVYDQEKIYKSQVKLEMNNNREKIGSSNNSHNNIIFNTEKSGCWSPQNFPGFEKQSGSR